MTLGLALSQAVTSLCSFIHPQWPSRFCPRLARCTASRSVLGQSVMTDKRFGGKILTPPPVAKKLRGARRNWKSMGPVPFFLQPSPTSGSHNFPITPSDNESTRGLTQWSGQSLRDLAISQSTVLGSGLQPLVANLSTRHLCACL